MTNPSNLRQFFTQISDTNDWILTLSNHSLGYFTKCDRAMQLYVLERRKDNRSTAAFSFGEAYHGCQEISIACSESQRPALQQAYISKFFSGLDLSEDEWRTGERLVDVMNRYAKTYTNDLVRVLKDEEGKPLSEIKFTLPLGKIVVLSEVDLGRGQRVQINTLYIQWNGRIDNLITLDGQNFVRDYKTSSMGGQTYFDQFVIGEQPVGYVWAVRQLLPSVPIHGFLADVAFCRKPTPTGKHTEFKRQRYYYSEETCQEWQLNTLAIIQSFVNNLIADFHPQRTHNCIGKFGKCGYHDVCSLPIAQRAMLLNSSEFTDVLEKADSEVSE